MRFTRALIVLAALGVAAPLPSIAEPAAQPGGDPEAVVTDLVSALGRMTNDPALSAADRERELAQILQQDCDLDRVTRFVLGAYLGPASEADRLQFSRLFQHWVTRSFAGSIGHFDADAVKITGEQPDASGAIVTTQVGASDHDPMRIEWHLARADSRYRIVDVAIQGISMAQVEREEMGAVIRHNGGTVAGLNQALAERFAGEETASATASR